jgi:hypothetical protein
MFHRHGGVSEIAPDPYRRFETSVRGTTIALAATVVGYLVLFFFH